MNRTPFVGRAVWMLLGAAGILLTGAAAEPAVAQSDRPNALKIGLLMDFSSGSTEAARDRQRAFDLAIKHVNDGGGVFGRAVSVAVGDTTANPETAVAVARRLVEVEGVACHRWPQRQRQRAADRGEGDRPGRSPHHQLLGHPPKLTAATDNDFQFRTALSDISQGPVLARVTRERDFNNVGLLYIDDAWGRGLARTFEAAWDGAIKAVAVERGQTSFLAELRESTSEGAQALVVIAFETAAGIMVREAIDNGLCDQFTFGDAAKRLRLVQSIGGARLGGQPGATAPRPTFRKNS